MLMEFLTANSVVILAALLAVSEVVAQNSVKSNSIFQMIVNGLKKLKG